MSSQRSGSHSFSASKSSTAFSADSSDTAASFRRPLREEACQMAVCGGHRQHLGELRTFIADIRPSGATPGSPDRCASQAGGGFWLQAWSTRKDVLRTSANLMTNDCKSLVVGRHLLACTPDQFADLRRSVAIARIVVADPVQPQHPFIEGEPDRWRLRLFGWSMTDASSADRNAHSPRSDLLPGPASKLVAPAACGLVHLAHRDG